MRRVREGECWSFMTRNFCLHDMFVSETSGFPLAAKEEMKIAARTSVQKMID